MIIDQMRQKFKHSGEIFLIYILFKIVLIFIRIVSGLFVDIEFIDRIKHKIERMELRVSYDYWFNKSKLINAYKYRIRYMVGIANGIYSGSPLKAQCYLKTISEPDFISLLEIDQETLNALSALKSCDEQINIMKNNNISADKILIVGPCAKISDIQYTKYSHIVFTKPPPFDVRKYEEKIILILNNQWVIQRRNELIKWLTYHSPKFIFSPQDISEITDYIPCAGMVPKFPLNTSLMGLQRALYIVLQNFDVQEIELSGFNYALASKPYEEWYPSLIPKEEYKKMKAIKRSLQVHDFVLNILFVRSMANCADIQITGECVDIARQPIIQNINKFQCIYGRYS